MLEPEDKQNWMIFKILKSGLSNFCCVNPNHRQPFTLLSLRQLAHLFEKAECLTDLDNFYWKTLLVAGIFGVMGVLRCSEFTSTSPLSTDIKTLRLENVDFYYSGSQECLPQDEVIPKVKANDSRQFCFAPMGQHTRAIDRASHSKKIFF